jgi:murein DD-endopeptidase MepM/ murein hydrolase activator NlpD
MLAAIYLTLAVAVAVPQGKAFAVATPHVEGMKGASLAWQGKKVPLARQDDAWTAAVGVDLDVKPGKYTASVEIQTDRGTRSEAIDVEVTAVAYPTRVLDVEPKYVDLAPADLERANRETERLNAIHRAVTNEKFWTEPFRAPVDGAIEASSFGSRSVFNGQARAPHAGADLKAATGTRILAANAGRVVLAEDLFFTGNTVIVDHGQGVYTLYAHLSRIDAKFGTKVGRGGLLGLSGATGRVTGPHLHWGVKTQDARVDPFSMLDIAKRTVKLP